jgi:hypothetical protein
MSDPFSPATRATYDAYNRIGLYNEPSFETDRKALAAALRAAVDQVVPEEHRPPRRGVRPGGTGALTPEEGAEDQQAATRRRFLAIAAELEETQ